MIYYNQSQYREVVCNDDLPVTILAEWADVWAERLGRTLGPTLLSCNTLAKYAKISSKIYRVYFQMVRL